MKKKINISISLQISIFLIIVAFIPVAIMISLKTYEKQQLSMMENSNVQQGRIVSATLETNQTDKDDLIDKTFARDLLNNMDGRFDARIRILDSSGLLIADSSSVEENQDKSIGNKTEYTGRALEEPKNVETKEKEPFVYRLFSYPVRIYRRYFKRPAASYETADYYASRTVFDGEEVQEALKGKYGAVTRISGGGQVCVTLYSAIPVIKNEKVCGVVLVNRSTYKILQNLYDLRLDLGKIFLRSLLVVLIIAVFLAFRIVHPIKLLSKQAVECADKKGRIFFTDFAGKKRRDEIGELSKSFTSLIDRLNKRIKFSQAFSSDIAHEYKNPLTAIRTSAELLGSTELSQKEKTELSNAIIDEVSHLETLLNGVRNISKIDAGIMEEEANTVPVNTCVKHIIKRLENKYPQVHVSFESNQDEISLALPQDYLDRVTENLIDNAMSFGKNVNVSSELGKDFYCLKVQDDGKGVNPEIFEKIFERFYSERKQTQEKDYLHTGLGLSIVKSIADSLEGKITVAKSEALGGAEFSFYIPVNKS